MVNLTEACQQIHAIYGLKSWDNVTFTNGPDGSVNIDCSKENDLMGRTVKKITTTSDLDTSARNIEALIRTVLKLRPSRGDVGACEGVKYHFNLFIQSYNNANKSTVSPISVDVDKLAASAEIGVYDSDGDQYD